MAKSSLSGAADDGWGNRNRSGDDADLDITPMIDVTFLLLIFFMVTSTMQSTPDLDIPPAKHGIGVDTKESVEITINAPASSGDVPVFLYDGQELSLDQIRSVISEGMQAGKNRVIILADREVPTGFVGEVAKMTAEFEGMKLSYGIRDENK